MESLGATSMQTRPPAARPTRPVHVIAPRAVYEDKPNGVVYVRSTESLGGYPDRLTDCLRQWAQTAPNRIFLAQRGPDGEWRTTTYTETWRRVRCIAAGLLRLGLSSATPLIILSGNSIEHALMALAAMHVGVPYAPIAPSYSLSVHEYAALTHVWQNLAPGIAFVQDGSHFSSALRAAADGNVRIVHHGSAPNGFSSISLDDLESTEPSPDVDRAHEQTGPDSVVKILYTSGSTGLPKGVITTNRMLCSNQQMLRQVMPYLGEAPPVICDWLPWNHTFGGSHNFGIALYNGGTLYIDGGKPTPESFPETVRNLREIAPTAYFNVPKGYEMLLEHLRQDAVLRRTFLSRVKLLFFAAAGLNKRTWNDLQQIAYETCGEEILIVTGLGATESAPFAFSTGIEGSSPGWIGLPVPGVDVKLAQVGERTEARLRGPSITPGYWRRPDLNASAFDEEGYYRMGDALKLLDPSDPQRGFLFDGRLNEEFKLSSGTWVRTGTLRMRLLAHFAGLVQDVVLAAPDCDYVSALIFPSCEACRKLVANFPETACAPELLSHPKVRSAFEQLLNSFALQNPGISAHVRRAILLDSPPSMEAREITDKGTLNQRAVLQNRAAVVDELYREPAPREVLTIAPV